MQPEHLRIGGQRPGGGIEHALKGVAVFAAGLHGRDHAVTGDTGGRVGVRSGTQRGELLFQGGKGSVQAHGMAAQAGEALFFHGGLGADGPRNLYNAVLTAATPETAKQGVVVAMDNIVVGAREVIKTNTVQPETFQAANFGKVGTIFNNKVTYSTLPVRAHTTATPFDVTGLKELPKVGIVYNHAGVEGLQAEALVKAGYKGIVNAGVGNGNIHKSIWPVLEQATKNGAVVVRSSRVPTGATTKDAEVDDKAQHWVSSGELNPQKARVLLQLALTKTSDWKEVQKYFDLY